MVVSTVGKMFKVRGEKILGWTEETVVREGLIGCSLSHGAL